MGRSSSGSRANVGSVSVVFAAWGRLVYRHRRIIVVLSIVVAGGLGIFAARVSHALSSGGWIDQSSESAAVLTADAELFDAPSSSFVLIYSSLAATPVPRRSRAASPRAWPACGVIRASTPSPATRRPGAEQFVSTDGTGAYVVVGLRLKDEQAVDQIDSLRTRDRPSARDDDAGDGLRPPGAGRQRPVREGSPACGDGLPAVGAC